MNNYAIVPDYTAMDLIRLAVGLCNGEYSKLLFTTKEVISSYNTIVAALTKGDDK